LLRDVYPAIEGFGGACDFFSSIYGGTKDYGSYTVEIISYSAKMFPDVLLLMESILGTVSYWGLSNYMVWVDERFI
jgi:hypothetical protein